MGDNLWIFVWHDGSMTKDGRGPAEKTLTFRRRRGRQIALAVWFVAAVGIGVQLLVNGWKAFDSPLTPWLTAVSWLVYGMAGLPRVTISESGLELCNGVMTHYIPFSAVDDLQNRYKVFINAEGRKYVSEVSAPPGSNVVGSDVYIPLPASTRMRNDHGGSLENLSSQDPVTADWLSGRPALSCAEGST